VTRHGLEITVCAEQDEIVPNAKLSEQRVDRPQLNSIAATPISQRRRLDMIVAIRKQQG